MSEPDEAAVEAVERWSVAGEPGTYANPVHLLWPDDQDPDLPHRFTESHFAEAWPNTEDSIVAPAFAALVADVRTAASHERAVTEVLTERDEAQEWADRLAAVAGGPEVIGEHSNMNNPWANAHVVLVRAFRDAERLRNLAARFEVYGDDSWLGTQIAAMLRGDGA